MIMEKTILTEEDIRKSIRKTSISNLIVLTVSLVFLTVMIVWLLNAFGKGGAIMTWLLVVVALSSGFLYYLVRATCKSWIGFRYPEFSVVVAKRVPTPKNQPETYGDTRRGPLGYYIYFENYGRYECDSRTLFDCMLYGEECYLVLDKKYNITRVYQCYLYEYTGKLSGRKKNYSE